MTTPSYPAIEKSKHCSNSIRSWNEACVILETEIFDASYNDMRLVQHEDGWIYGLFHSKRRDTDHDSAVAYCGFVRTKDLKNWERLPDIEAPSIQHNIVLHPKFVGGQYALYMHPQDRFINTAFVGDIGWVLCDSMEQAGESTL